MLDLPLTIAAVTVRSPDFYVGWGTLMFINAGIAQGKNRSGTNWFLLTLLLGPIATFLLTVFYDKLPYGHDQIPATSE